jgi:hypothetical protein
MAIIYITQLLDKIYIEKESKDAPYILFRQIFYRSQNYVKFGLQTTGQGFPI